MAGTTRTNIATGCLAVKSAHRAGWLAAALLCSAAPLAALAQTRGSDQGQTAYGPEIEAVTVTAQRVKENLQTTPVAVSAFTSKSLEVSSVTNLTELGSSVPNLTMSDTGAGSGGNSNPQIFMRGVGQVDFLITTDPGVAIYVDGVYYARSTGSAFDVQDLERVEVLRGPQGTLFGKNAIGGVIQLISKPPGDAFGGHAELTTGSYGRLDARGAVDIPLSDTLHSRFSAVAKTRGGYTDRILAGDKMGNQNQYDGRAEFEWTPTDDLRFTLALDGTTGREEGVNEALVKFDPTKGLAPLWIGLVAIPQGLTLPTVNKSTPFVNSGTGPNRSDLDLWGAALTGEWNLGNVQLKSITAYRTLRAIFGRDGDNSPSSYISTFQHDWQAQVSQELQLNGNSFNSRLKWTTGLYYFNEKATDQNEVRLASGLWSALEGLPGPVIPLSPNPCPTACLGGPGNPLNALFDLDFHIFNRIETSSYAAYGQGSYNLTDALSVTVGLRYTKEDKSYYLKQSRVNSGVYIVPPTTVTASFNDLSPHFGIEYQATDQIFTYLSATKGFKSGGFNGRPTSVAEIQSYGPEKLWSYEAGVKSEMFDRRMRLNLAIFHNAYKDIQISSVSADANGNLLLLTENAGAATLDGAEAELVVLPVEGLTLTSSAGFMDAYYTKLNPGASVTKQDKFMKTPRWTLSASASYTVNLSDTLGVLMLRGDWSYKSTVYNDPQNTPEIAQGPLSLFNARLAWSDPSDRYEVALFGTNLTDERYIVSGISAIDSFGTIEANYGRPREWGLSVSAKF